MVRRTVKTLEQWAKLKPELIEKGYRMWQWQYNWNLEEGFHANFSNGRHDVEVITYLQAVQDDIFESKMYDNDKYIKSE